jgi:catechol 2,3-dioxygenase-like lactoylglutathione lyase family enzyme
MLQLLLLLLGSAESFTVLRTDQGQRPLLKPLHAEAKHPMAESSRLSHVMLKVPSVDATAAYWTEKGGKIKISKEKLDSPNGQAELLSAFVELGCMSSIRSISSRKDDGDGANKDNDPACFALELVATNKKNYSIGNVLSYVGVSMLLQFQNNLLGALRGDEKPKSQGDEPNGIPVNSAASAPGDFFARLALKSNDFVATNEFYTSVLGMDSRGQDEKMLCLRYDNDCFSGGIPTTLVFDATTEELDVGDCFDHLVVATKADINELHSQMKAERIFMKPTEMFGKQVMGLFDPNGYKVVICSV